MKNLLIALPLLSAALFNTAMAENNVEKQVTTQPKNKFAIYDKAM